MITHDFASPARRVIKASASRQADTAPARAGRSGGRGCGGFILAGGLSLLALFAASRPARAGYLFLSSMDGSQQVPPVPTPATGTAVTYLSADQTHGWIKVKVQNLTSPVVAAHIHYGSGGFNGPQIYDLGPFTDSTVVDFGPIAPNILPAILAGNTYVNVHTTDYLNGEIRGQIVPQASRSFTAYINNTQEVPVTNSSATGWGDLTLWGDQSRLHLDLSVQNFVHPMTGSEIDRAPLGQNGPLVFLLGAFNDRTVLDLFPTADQVQDLGNGLLYINIRSQTYPAGEIRGQIEESTPAAVGESARSAAAGSSLTASPNPVRQSTTFHWSRDRRGAMSTSQARLRILDLSGRAIRVLAESRAGGTGEGVISWDGRDQHGHSVPGGVYFARLEDGSNASASNGPAAGPANTLALIVIR